MAKLTDEGINLAGVVRILDMRERAVEKDDEIDELRARVRELEDELHEYKMRERITSLARYEESSPEQIMQRLLGMSSGAEDAVDNAEKDA